MPLPANIRYFPTLFYFPLLKQTFFFPLYTNRNNRVKIGIPNYPYCPFSKIGALISQLTSFQPWQILLVMSSSFSSTRRSTKNEFLSLSCPFFLQARDLAKGSVPIKISSYCHCLMDQGSGTADLTRHFKYL